jgi:hypothetical protein
MLSLKLLKIENRLKDGQNISSRICLNSENLWFSVNQIIVSHIFYILQFCYIFFAHLNLFAISVELWNIVYCGFTEYRLFLFYLKMSISFQNRWICLQYLIWSFFKLAFSKHILVLFLFFHSLRFYCF